MSWLSRLLHHCPVVRVQVGRRIRTYPLDLAGYAEFRAAGNRTPTLAEALDVARHLFGVLSSAVTLVCTWVDLDDSGLAYRIAIDRRLDFRILAACPMPGPDNIRTVYIA